MADADLQTTREREAKALTRIQVLTPLSVLVSAGANIVCALVLKKNLGYVGRKHPTYVTPNDRLLLIYWAVLYLLQIGFSLLLVLGRKPETKAMIIHGVGTRLAIANYLLALWAVFWVLDARWAFFAGFALLSINALLLLATAALLAFKYPPQRNRPLDWIFVHVPIKMFLVTLLMPDLWQQLFIALGWSFDHGSAVRTSTWPAFGLITGLSVFSSLWIFATTDVTWAIAGIYQHVSILLYSNLDTRPGEGGRPAPVFAALVLAIALQATAFFASLAWKRLSKRREGRIALPMSPEEERAAAQAEDDARAEAEAVHGAIPPKGNATNGAYERVPNDEEAQPGVTRTLGGAGASRE